TPKHQKHGPVLQKPVFLPPTAGDTSLPRRTQIEADRETFGDGDLGWEVWGEGREGSVRINVEIPAVMPRESRHIERRGNSTREQRGNRGAVLGLPGEQASRPLIALLLALLAQCASFAAAEKNPGDIGAAASAVAEGLTVPSVVLGIAAMVVGF
ncbi:MAG: hypothetical protein BJ554DRAFT_7500, partial [Olpidium bornovanus]